MKITKNILVEDDYSTHIAKMTKWENDLAWGNAKRNVKAMGTDKLNAELAIAGANPAKFPNVLQALKAEAKSRGYVFEEDIELAPMDFHPADLIFIKENNKSAIINNIYNDFNLGGTDWLKFVITTIIWLIMLGQNDLATEIKDIIVKNGWIKVNLLKKVITDAMQNKDIMDRILLAISDKNESLSIKQLSKLQELLDKPENNLVKEYLQNIKNKKPVKEMLLKLDKDGKAECNVVVDHNSGWFKSDKSGGILLAGKVAKEGVWKNFVDDLECEKEDLEITWLGDYDNGRRDESYYHVIYTQPQINESADLNEKVEKHDTLNPKLWNEDNTLKPEVEEKINQIVQEFVDGLAEDEIKIDVDDIVIIGSNCSYNYNEGSDLDVHIRANTDTLDCPEKHLDKLYSAYRSLFNKKFGIDFYGIPVELYVETGDLNTISNGVYSVKNKQWIKEPVQADIPEVDEEAINEQVGEWTSKYNEVVESRNIDEIDQFIEDVYNLRKEAMAKGEEYNESNLVFKELRNAGYLDNLKELKAEIKSEQLSLESLQEDTVKIKDHKWVNKGNEGTHGEFKTKKAADAQRKAMFANGYKEELEERLFDKEIRDYKVAIWKAIRPFTSAQPIIHGNGIVEFNLVKENEVDKVMYALRRLDFIKNVTKAAGKFDFSRPTFTGNQARYWSIHCQIIENEDI